MSITRCAGFYGKTATLWVTMVIALLCTALTALGLLAAALLIWLDHYFGLAPAVALTGALLLLVTLCIFIGFRLALKQMHNKAPSLGGNLFGMAAMAMRVALLAVRRSPRKAVVLAVILGALADYLTAKPDHEA